jgi:hypothetical protein
MPGYFGPMPVWKPRDEFCVLAIMLCAHVRVIRYEPIGSRTFRFGQFRALVSSVRQRSDRHPWSTKPTMLPNLDMVALPTGYTYWTGARHCALPSHDFPSHTDHRSSSCDCYPFTGIHLRCAVLLTVPSPRERALVHDLLTRTERIAARCSRLPHHLRHPDPDNVSAGKPT